MANEDSRAPRLLLLQVAEHNYPAGRQSVTQDVKQQEETEAANTARLGRLIFEFLDLAVMDLGLTGEQISIFSMALERTMHLCSAKRAFTEELAQQAVDEEIALRKRIAGLDFSLTWEKAPPGGLPN